MTYRLLLPVAALIVRAVGAQAANSVTTACIDDTRLAFPGPVIEASAAVATDMYADAAIALEWTNYRSGDRIVRRCPEEAFRIEVLFTRMRPSRVDPSALAVTSFSGATAETIYIYYDAVEAYARTVRVPVRFVLGTERSLSCVEAGVWPI